jgi:group I intron endonuclease
LISYHILSENRGKVGIYKWTNKESGNSYIGSSIDLNRRLREYFSLAYLKKYQKSSAICNALLSNQHSAFSLEILEYCSKINLRKREDHYFKLLKPEYNILPKAGSSLGFKH